MATTHKDSAPDAGQNAWMITTIIFAALLILSLVWNGILTIMLAQGGLGSGSGSGAQLAPSAPNVPSAPSGAPVAVSADDDPAIGDGKVQIIEFSDFECPFCGRFHEDSFNQIKADYIDTGKVTFVYRDYPLSFHPRAMPAAVAAQCVYELSDDETYFEYHSLLFENQADLSDANLKTMAKQVGVSESKFTDCIADEDGSIAAEINKDLADGQAAGVTGTPTLFINGNKIVGAQPYNVFKAAIDAELN